MRRTAVAAVADVADIAAGLAVRRPTGPLFLFQILVDARLHLEKRRHLLLVRVQVDDGLFVRMQVAAENDMLLVLAEMVDFRLRVRVVAVMVRILRMHVRPVRFDHSVEPVLPVGRIMHAAYGAVRL